jgi:hypothetical protein
MCRFGIFHVVAPKDPFRRVPHRMRDDLRSNAMRRIRETARIGKCKKGRPLRAPQWAEKERNDA